MVGLAIGFGAQTLVKDIISGIFFLVDDAFRVGDYVDAGKVKGLVGTSSSISMVVRIISPFDSEWRNNHFLSYVKIYSNSKGLSSRSEEQKGK
mgnify:CR=1 FL=1